MKNTIQRNFMKFANFTIYMVDKASMILSAKNWL